MGQEISIEDHLFNLKYTSKTLQRQSRKLEKQEKQERTKIKQAIQKGNMEGARIYGENAIRSKNQALNFLRMASRIDAVSNRVETAVRMQQVTRSMGGVVHGMDAVLKSMDLEKISGLMDRFESVFEDLDVQSATMEESMAVSSGMTAPQSEVDALIMQVAEENSLQLTEDLDGASVPAQKAPAAAATDDLTARLAALKNQ